MLRVPGQIDQLMHDFETGNLMVRAVTPALDEVPRHLHALGGRLSLAAFAASATIATAIAAPAATASTARWVGAICLAAAAVAGWCGLVAWHWFGHRKPVKVAALLRILRR